MMRKKAMRALLLVGLLAVMISMCSMTAFAAGDVAGAIEQTWNTAKAQIQTVVNNVVFPVVDMILAILFFVKVGTSYFEYRKHGQFEFGSALHSVRLPHFHPDRTAVYLVYPLIRHAGPLRKAAALTGGEVIV